MFMRVGTCDVAVHGAIKRRCVSVNLTLVKYKVKHDVSIRCLFYVETSLFYVVISPVPSDHSGLVSHRLDIARSDCALPPKGMCGRSQSNFLIKLIESKK